MWRAILIATTLFTISYNSYAQIYLEDEYKIYYIKIDPRGTYLNTDICGEPNCDDTPNSPTVFSLQQLPSDSDFSLQPGDYINLRLEGDFKPGEDFDDEHTSLISVFHGPSGYFNPGPYGTTYPVETIIGDIFQDFSVFNDTEGTWAQIPEGVTQLLFSVDDAYYGDNTDPDADFQVVIKIPIVKTLQTQLVKKAFDSKGNEINPNRIDMIPSIVKCSIHIPTHNEKRRFFFQCIDTDTAQPVADCKINLNLLEGTVNGGHTHEQKLLGLLSTSGLHTIPIGGFEVEYTSPEAAGEIIISINAQDPNGERIPTTNTILGVRNESQFAPVSIPGLNFSINSHPDGNWGTVLMNLELADLVTQYKDRAKTLGVPIKEIPDLRSAGGVSLPWGWVFDFTYNWSSPHCSHRTGKMIDISTKRVFNDHPYESELIASLNFAALDAGFAFYVLNESPSNPDASHWHITLK